MGSNYYKYARFVYNFLTCFIVLTLIQLPTQGVPLPQPGPGPEAYQNWPLSTLNFASHGSEKYESWNQQNKHIQFATEKDKESQRIAEMATKIIAGIVISLVLASFVAFLICLCCPICILAKMRQRRRGFVYQTASSNPNGVAGATIQNERTSVTVLQSGSGPSSHLPSHQQGIQVITTNTSNSPYPVQPSVTVIPHQHQQQQHQMSSYHGQNPNAIPYPVPNQTAPGPYSGGMPMPMMSNNFPSHNINHQHNPNAPPQDLPPPYPGLPREVDSANNPNQPAYNPYFNEGGDAPNPYAPTTAPYPTKH